MFSIYSSIAMRAWWSNLNASLERERGGGGGKYALPILRSIYFVQWTTTAHPKQWRLNDRRSIPVKDGHSFNQSRIRYASEVLIWEVMRPKSEAGRLLELYPTFQISLRLYGMLFGHVEHLRDLQCKSCCFQNSFQKPINPWALKYNSLFRRNL
jgi:hypothetical protein